jgi:hypothetical protein
MPGEIVFHYGMIINEMIFIVDGVMENLISETEEMFE